MKRTFFFLFVFHWVGILLAQSDSTRQSHLQELMRNTPADIQAWANIPDDG